MKIWLDGQPHQTQEHQNLLEFLREHGAPPPAPCNGHGRCGRCQVMVDGDWVLACQTRVSEGQHLTSPRWEQGLGPEIAPCGPPSGALWGEGLGLALDLGTTTLALAIINLSTGEILGQAHAPNPQAAYGADLMSRLEASESGEDLSTPLWQGVKEILKQLSPDQSAIMGGVVVGNTAMIHLALGLPTATLSRSPHLPHAQGPFWRTGQILDLPQANFFFPGSLQGFVGSDALAGAYWAGLRPNSPPSLFIDLGTNGEVLLATGQSLLATSTAAGPALEGVGIQCGIPASPQAILGILPDGSVKTGGGPPRGLAGSGLLSLLAHLRRQDLLLVSGRLLTDPYTLLPGIAIDQREIRLLQAAKGAIRAGIDLLLDEGGLAPEQLHSLYLAGALGTGLSPMDLMEIGLIPAINPQKVLSIGNAAGSGAALLLTQAQACQGLEELTQQTQWLDLAGHPRFFDAYATGCFLGEAL